MGKGQQTRERIMDIAESSILMKGFGATSIDEIIAEAEITKSGFFYHFRDKNELARALLDRYVDREDELLDDLFNRAAELHDDPLHAFLIGLKMLSEMMGDLPNGHPGCLVATICYNERLYDHDIREKNRVSVLSWRNRFKDTLTEIAEIYPPNEPVDLDDLADMVSTIVEGGIVMSKALQEPEVLAKQVLLLRSYVKMLFLPRSH
ncbi:TetR/AcrR family transcriptional regulator [Sneathiella limimaris]|uniref:TetR/AcrR family transcriptional regulator n=1 Tax=Sneathiella limimaris TaxID=1964213 RepID=UPI00146B7AEF|nr:TetR/AcrR family transcriptional regulator [Sneathiella limimaris]